MSTATGPAVENLYQTESSSLEYRSVYLRSDADGSISIDAQDLGPTVEAVWGDEDYEFGVKVAPEAAAKLLFQLLKERYSENPDAVNVFRVELQRLGIPYEFWSWS